MRFGPEVSPGFLVIVQPFNARSLLDARAGVGFLSHPTNRRAREGGRPATLAVVQLQATVMSGHKSRKEGQRAESVSAYGTDVGRWMLHRCGGVNQRKLLGTRLRGCDGWAARGIATRIRDWTRIDPRRT